MITDCLATIGIASGEQVSKNKTWIFFLKNVSASLASNLSVDFGFQVTIDLEDIWEHL